MEPVYFSDGKAFRGWLAKNHDKATELLVGFYKTSTGKKTMTWPESVDQALCFGWIDGVRKGVDEERYTIRFTPRKPKSNWSAVNLRKMQELIDAGLMQPAGLAIFEKREQPSQPAYSYEREKVSFSKAYEKIFRLDKKARAFFQAQSDYYRQRMTNWVMSAKTEKTQLSRLKKLIDECAAGKKFD
jgi:uncharacterized protein YdeI (YjbR/CyaY-like superfamily)